MFDFTSRYIIRLRQLNKVWVYHFGKRIALLMEELLPLAYHPEEAVVQYHDLHRYVVLHDGAQFLYGHLVSAITDYCHNFFFCATHFCSERGGQGKAHCSGAT